MVPKFQYNVIIMLIHAQIQREVFTAYVCKTEKSFY